MRGGALVACLALGAAFASGCLEAPDGPGGPGQPDGGAGDDAGPLACPGGPVEGLLDQFTGELSGAWEIFTTADDCRAEWIDDDVEIANDGVGACGIRSTATYEALDGAITLFLDPEGNLSGRPDIELRLVIDGDRRVSVSLAEREVIGRACTRAGCSVSSMASGEMPERLRIESVGGRVEFAVAEVGLEFEQIGLLRDPGLATACVTVEAGSYGLPGEDQTDGPVVIDGINVD